MNYLLLFIISVIPSIIILSIVYRNDKEKEPFKLLLSLFLFGILSIFLTLIISYVLEHIFPIFKVDKIENIKSIGIKILYSFIFVGFVEEFSKWIFNRAVAVKSREFNHVYDAIVYAVFSSLGFATIENILYVLSSNITTGILRCVFSVPCHAFFGVAMGYYTGLSKLALLNKNKKLYKKYSLLSLFVPTLLHGLYDFCLFSGNVFLILFDIAFVVFLYVYGIRKINQFADINVDFLGNNLNTNSILYKKCSNCGELVTSEYCTNCGTHVNN